MFGIHKKIVALLLLFLALSGGSVLLEGDTCQTFAPAQAAEEGNSYKIGTDIPSVGTVTPSKGTGAIANYIKGIYGFAIGIVGIVAALVIMMGGVMWITAGGNTSRIENAKSWITAALTGLVIALSSYAILYTVNPDLVNLRTRTMDLDLEERPEFNLSSYGCSWEISQSCPNSGKSQEMTNTEKYCGEKPDPAGAGTPEDYNICCCPPDVGNENSEGESCLGDETPCHEGGPSGSIDACSECCNGWHYKGAQPVCGSG